MADNNHMLLRANLKQLKLPAIAAEFVKLARQQCRAGAHARRRLPGDQGLRHV